MTRHRILILSSIAATGYIISLFVSSLISPLSNHLRAPLHHDAIASDHGRQLMAGGGAVYLSAFNDPKTVQARPLNNNAGPGPNENNNYDAARPDDIARFQWDGSEMATPPPNGGEIQGVPNGGEMQGVPVDGEMQGAPNGGEMQGGPQPSIDDSDNFMPVPLDSGGVGPSIRLDNGVEDGSGAVEGDVTTNVDEVETMLNDLKNDAAGHSTITSAHVDLSDEPDLDYSARPYNVDNALATTQAFRYTLFFFVYDSASDEFVIVHNIRGCDHGCARIYRVASVTAYALRKNFPDRFKKGESDDLVFMMSTGDAPRIKNYCLSATENYCHSSDFAPILNFGSIFVNKNFLPTMVAMPLPVRPHIPCFDEWQISGSRKGEVCQDLRAKSDLGDGSIKGGLMFGEELGIIRNGDEGEGGGKYWANLIPQVIWRGTDFVFLHTMFPEMRSPQYAVDIAPHESTMPQSGSPEEDRRWAINTLWGMGDMLLPRWRGVLLTSEAEIEAREYANTIGEPKIPWANIKFANLNVNGVKQNAADNPEFQTFQKLGITALGEYVSMEDQAKYRYHVDLGGGGGTTWTGTIEKLAMPGLLFHHVTPTKDWFHDLLVPWEHYVPVRADLSDLREKFLWAETHPEEARRISEQGTAFVRWIGSPDGFARLYDDFMVKPLSDVINAYIPPPHKYSGKTVLEVVMERGEKEGFQIVGTCSGLHSNACSKLA